MEKEPHNEDLQASHCDHDQALQYAEVENTLLRAPHRGEVPVLSRAEVFLVSVDGRQLGGDFEDGFFEDGGLLGSRALLGRELCACFVLNLESVSMGVGRPDGRWNNSRHTAISKSTTFSAKVDISLLKQKRYSPRSLAVKTKSPCLSFSPFEIMRSLGATTT